MGISQRQAGSVKIPFPYRSDARLIAGVQTEQAGCLLMHEFGLMNDLLNKIDGIARQQGAERVVGVTVWLGALSHISAGHFREHFVHGARGTVADGAELAVETSTDTDHPQAQQIVLRRIEVADAG